MIARTLLGAFLIGVAVWLMALGGREVIRAWPALCRPGEVCPNWGLSFGVGAVCAGALAGALILSYLLGSTLLDQGPSKENPEEQK